METSKNDNNPNSSKGGRPKINNPRVIRHIIYFNELEYNKLNSFCNNSDFKDSLNRFIRAMLFDDKVKLYSEDVSKKQIINKLNKIGSNHHQILKHFNALAHAKGGITKSDITGKMYNEIKIIADYLRNITV